MPLQVYMMKAMDDKIVVYHNLDGQPEGSFDVRSLIGVLYCV